MKLVKFLKYVRPDEAMKWYNREEYRTIYVNPQEVSYITKNISTYYENKVEPYFGSRQIEVTKTVMTINMRNGEHFEVEGTEDEVINKISKNSI